MAGHSHASNVKHKKSRNDKLKCDFFLKLRRKIELAYNSSKDREKVFSIAREYNFPKEKVNSIIEKIESSKLQENLFTEILYKGKYEILVYLRGTLLNHQNVLLKENVEKLSLEKLYGKKPGDFFHSTYWLRISGCENVEEIIISSLSPLVVDKIDKIEKKEETELEFKILFNEKEALSEAVEFFTTHQDIHLIESGEDVKPFFPAHGESEDFLSYFSLFESLFSKLDNNLQVFTNVSSKKKWDHSSVG